MPGILGAMRSTIGGSSAHLACRACSRGLASRAEAAALLHIPEKASKGAKGLLEVAAGFPKHGVGMRFLRKVGGRYPVPPSRSGDLRLACPLSALLANTAAARWPLGLATARAGLLLGADQGPDQDQTGATRRRLSTSASKLRPTPPA